MRNSYLQELAKKIEKKNGKLLYSHEIKKMISSLMKDEYTDTKAYKLIYYLKNRGYLLSIKKEIFFAKHPDDTRSDDDIVDEYYRHILHHHCTTSFDKQRYIWSLKALELHYTNYSIPESILVINATKQSKEMIVATKAVQFKKYTAKGENFYPKFKRYTSKIKIGKYSFAFANKELALLECMYNFDDMFDKYTYEMVKKVIKKSTHLDTQTITKIITLGKHHTSINRLYKIAKDVNKTFASQLGEIIKRYSFFLDV